MEARSITILKLQPVLSIPLYETPSDTQAIASARHQDTSYLLEPQVLCQWAMATGQPPTFTILYMYCTGGTECLSRIPRTHSVCAITTQLGVDQKILSIRKELILSGFLTLNTQNILPQAVNKEL